MSYLLSLAWQQADGNFIFTNEVSDISPIDWILNINNGTQYPVILINYWAVDENTGKRLLGCKLED